MPTFKLQIKTEEHMNYSAVSIAQRQKTSFRLFCFPPSSAASVRSPLVPTHHRQASHGPFLLQKPAKQEAKQQVGVAFNNEEITGNSEAGVLQRPWKQVSPKKKKSYQKFKVLQESWYAMMGKRFERPWSQHCFSLVKRCMYRRGWARPIFILPCSSSIRKRIKVQNRQVCMCICMVCMYFSEENLNDAFYRLWTHAGCWASTGVTCRAPSIQ